MSLFSSIKSLFSGNHSADQAPEAFPSESYKGFTITPAPVREELGFRVNGTITKDEQNHLFVRADMLPTAEECAKEVVRKAKQMIDQQGDNIF